MLKLSLPGKVKPIAFKSASTILAHKILILFLIALSLAAGVLFQLRANFIAETKIDKDSNSSLSVLIPTPAPESQAASESATEPEPSVLGISTEVPTFKPVYFPPLPTFSPIPVPTSYAVSLTATPTPVVVSSSPTTVSTSSSSSSSGHTCSSMGVSPGVPTEWYSQASKPQTVSSTATINIELKDCNNRTALVVETLTISQSSGPATTVNGSSPPISIVTSNGRASFTVKAQTSGTAVYIVRTSKSFDVTDIDEDNPQVTFTISAPTPSPASNAASPTPSPSPSPSPSASSSPASSTAAPTPSPTASATPTPSP